MIEDIPTHELKSDLDDSYADIMNCEAALKLGITQHNGYDIQERLDRNKRFIEVITAELERRGEAVA